MASLITVAAAGLLLLGLVAILPFLVFTRLLLDETVYKRLYSVWLLGLSSMAAMNIGHLLGFLGLVFLQDFFQLATVVFSLCAFALAMRRVSSHYSWLEAQSRLEEAVRERTRDLVVSEEKYRMLVENVFDCICLLDTEGKFLYMNPCGLRQHGIAGIEGVAGRHCMELAAEKYRGVIEDTLKRARKGETVTFEYESMTPRGRVYWESTLGPICDEEGRVARLLRVSRDITERRRAEEEVRLLLMTMQRIGESQDFHRALEVTIRKVCEATGWDYGEAWLPSPDGTVLRGSPAWYGSVKSLEKFRRFSEDLTFPPGTGLPGRVWSSKQPEWDPDVSIEPETLFLRAKIARETGIKAGFGVPILVKDEVLAVLVFFMFESREEDKHLVEVISAVAKQLGSLLQRKRMYEELQKAYAKLQKQVEELEIFHRVAVGRELKMVELKEEIKKLEARIEELESRSG